MYKLSESKINEVKCKVWEMDDERKFPVFDTDKKTDFYEKYPYYRYAEYTKSEEIVSVVDIVGSNWAFDTEEDRGRYPARNKILAILDAYKGKYLYGNKRLPAVPLDRVFGRYFLDEGNHRLYTLKLMESFNLIQTPVIRAKVQNYDYESFLKSISFISRYDTMYIKFKDDTIEPIDCDTHRRLLDLKEAIQKGVSIY